MRIRRNASKLLGSASAAAYAKPSPAPAAAVSAAAAAPVEEFTVCELNRSPWDVIDSNICNFLGNPKEEEERGILGNFFKAEGEEPISGISGTAAELTLKEMKEMENKKVKRKERKKVCKGKETVAVDTITYCKKSDGKGWHCKRLAQLPSSFCSYHLAQIRSYSSNNSHRAADASAAAAAAAGNGRIHQTKSAVAGETGAGSSFYYYYNGFGPWRSKRRGRDGVDACDEVKEAVKDDMDSKERLDDDDDDNDDDNVAAGKDEYDLDCFDDDDDNLYSMAQDNEASYKKEGEMEKKRVLKKRGRKPLKCRSLKSLL